jgi:hypothetical protein
MYGARHQSAVGAFNHLPDLHLRSIQHKLDRAGVQPDNILCLSFFPSNAGAIRQALLPRASEFLPCVTALQRFQTLVLRR